MFPNNLLDFAQFSCTEAEITGKGHWLEPELGGQIIPVNVDVRRLVYQVMAIEVESVWPGS